jgi:hypothetical protein
VEGELDYEGVHANVVHPGDVLSMEDAGKALGYGPGSAGSAGSGWSVGGSPDPRLGLGQFLGSQGLTPQQYQAQYGGLPFVFNPDGTVTFDPAARKNAFSYEGTPSWQEQVFPAAIIALATAGMTGLLPGTTSIFGGAGAGAGAGGAGAGAGAGAGGAGAGTAAGTLGEFALAPAGAINPLSSLEAMAGTLGSGGSLSVGSLGGLESALGAAAGAGAGAATTLGLGATGTAVAKAALTNGIMAEIRGGNFLEGAILGAVTAGISSGLSATGLNDLVKTALERDFGVPPAAAAAAGKAVSNTIAAATVAGAQGKDVGAVLIRGLVNAGADVGGAVLARSIAGLGGDSGPMADAAKFFKDNPAIANATASGLGSAIIATAQGGDVGEAITYGVTSSLVTSGIKGTLGNNANTRLQQDLVKYLTPVVQAAVTGGDVERALQTSIVSGAVDYVRKATNPRANVLRCSRRIKKPKSPRLIGSNRLSPTHIGV